MSIFSQSYENIELIIVNDGSSDETKQFLDSLTHPKITIHIIHQDKAQGACVARNLAIKKAEGKFITGLDDDDEFMAQRIADFVEHYDPNYSFICTGFYWDYGKKRRLVNGHKMTINLSKQLDYNYASNQVFVETNRLKSIDGFDETFRACQDYDTWTRLIEKFGPAKRISGGSYIIHRGDDTPRLTESSNWLRGHDQYMHKHQNKMSTQNTINQKFRRIIASRSRMSSRELLVQIRAGLVSQKIKYFLSSNVKIISTAKKYLFENRQ